MCCLRGSGTGFAPGCFAGMKKPARGRFDLQVWCPGEDSNLHGFTR